MLDQIYYNTAAEMIRSGHANNCYPESNAVEWLLVRMFVNTVEEIFDYIACSCFCKVLSYKSQVGDNVQNCEQKREVPSGALLRPPWAPPAFWGLLSAFGAFLAPGFVVEPKGSLDDAFLVFISCGVSGVTVPSAPLVF